jgi:hypothetical protein
MVTRAPVAMFDRFVSEFDIGSSGGLVLTDATSTQGSRWIDVQRVREHLPEVEAVYFAEDVPLVYIAVAHSLSLSTLAAVHRKTWNDARVPLLVAIDDSHVRVYDAWATPTLDPHQVDREERLITILEATDAFLEKAPFLHRARLDTATYAADLPNRFDVTKRCDRSLLENLLATQERLIDEGLPPDVVHTLLIRSIFLRHLEDRGILGLELFGKYRQGAQRLADVYIDHDATYQLFSDLSKRFNGDIFPLSKREDVVEQQHLQLLGRFLRGEEDLKSGQPTLWPLYDFSVIPIQLISSVYQQLLHAKDPEEAKEAGVYYTRHPIVELMLNEVLPWPTKATPRRTLPRVMDPSCGSGVFLVEAYRRLVAHWKLAHPGKRPTPKELSLLMTSHIFGVDKDGDAVRIAAFSLYLALLDEVPSEIVWSQFRFPCLISASRNGASPNLVEGDAFEQTRTVDVVVGNPPWKRGRLSELAADWCRKRGYPVAAEIAQAFMWLCGELAPAGRIAIVTPTKWLFNRELPDVRFRREFFRLNHVETILNLSAFVGGDNRLFSASSPATVVIYRRPKGAAEQSPVLYCTPRPGAHARSPIALLIDAADIKWLPREEAEHHDDVWKALYVGTWRDLRLVRRVITESTVTKFLKEKKSKGWVEGRGFQTPGKKKAPKLLKLPFVDAADVTRIEVVPTLTSTTVQTDGFSRVGPLGIYDGPHILMKEGLPNGRLCASYVSFSATFKDTITGIHAPARQANHLKALTAYLNSSLATYLVFMTTGWGIDRRRVKKGEVFGALPRSVLDNKAVVDSLAALMDQYFDRSPPLTRTALLERIDTLIYDTFDLSHGEKVLVAEMLTTSIDHIHNQGASKALWTPTVVQLTAYASGFISVMDAVLKRSGAATAAIVHDGAAPLRVVSFQIGKPGKDPIRVERGTKLDEVLGRLDKHLLQQDGTNLFRRRHARVFEHRSVHVVKPAENRYWTEGAAFADADDVVGQTLAGVTRGNS